MLLISGSSYRQDAAKRQTAGIKFTQEAKNQHFPMIFAPQGRLLAPIPVKFGTTKGHVGRLATRISRQLVHGGGNATPKMAIISIFGKESPCRGELFHRFLQLLRAFIRPTILH